MFTMWEQPNGLWTVYGSEARYIYKDLSKEKAQNIIDELNAEAEAELNIDLIYVKPEA